jgi:hypothetical protein
MKRGKSLSRGGCRTGDVTEPSRITKFIVFCDWLSIAVLDVSIKSLGFNLLAARKQLECVSAVKGGAV